MLNIINQQRNANQNYNEISSHNGQNGHHQKIYKHIVLKFKRLTKHIKKNKQQFPHSQLHFLLLRAPIFHTLTISYNLFK